MCRPAISTGSCCPPRRGEVAAVKPATRIEPPPWMSAPETEAVLAALGAGGVRARFVGGCVRDALLGRSVKDIDLATPEPPETVLRRLKSAGLGALPTGIDHGTVTAISGGRPFEVTTLRRDEETFGRHARVAFTDDWAADAARRDFTMNAMYADPDGTIYDPTGGLADLEAGRVRFVGDPAGRIEEDALRLLRFFRFHAHYGRGDADRAAAAAAAAAAPRLAILSGERLWAETHRLLAAPDPVPVLRLMERLGILAHLMAEARPDFAALSRLVGIEQARGEADPLRRLCLLLPHAASEGFAGRFRLSRRDAERLNMLTRPTEIAWTFDAAMRAAIYREGQVAMRERALLAWARAEPGAMADWPDLIRRIEEWSPPRLPVSGADVLALGVPSGPELGRLLRAVEAHWIANDFRDERPALLAELKRRATAASDRGY
ncbi:MAG: CCA tRNA nucleotidyltransferase [Alphaproteobacteria bacterium]|nr:CCA tRNA nucleotidyltransferase [Alphaproteobacteria bacterium]